MPTAAKSPQPSPVKSEPRSFFDLQKKYRTQAKSWALLINLAGCALTWGFGFVVIGALVLYTIFLSRLLPHQVTEIYAYVIDHTGGVIGLSVAAVLFTAGLWWFVTRIFVRDTSAGLIWRIGARLPDSADPEEQQLVTLIEQMAAATAAPKPAVFLYDGPAVNLALIGDRPDAAGMIVSRELLKALDPDETHGVVAQQLTSAINGDLLLTAAMLRGFQMIGTAVTLLDLPFSPPARRALALLWRYSRSTDRESAAALGEDVGAALTRCLQPDGLESLTIFLRKMIGEETDLRSIVSTVLLVPLLPLILLRLVAAIFYALANLFVLGPLAALVLRSRCGRADSTTVKLTQNADGLARGLIHLDGLNHVFSEAGWSEMNFIVGHEAANAQPFDRFRARVAKATMTMNNFSQRLSDTKRVVSNPPPINPVAGHNFVFGFHPPLGTRIVDLKKHGAEVAWPEGKDNSSWIIAAVPTGVVALVLLILLA